MKKRILALVMIVTLMSVLATIGCSTPAPAPAPAPAPTPAPAAPEKVITWKMQSGFVTGDPWYMVADAVANRINTASGGRLVLDLYAAGAIVPGYEETEGLRTGAIDMTQTANAASMHLDTAFGLLEQMPGCMTNVQLKYWYTAGEGAALATEMYEPYGITFLGPWLAAPEDFAYTNFPLETLSDVKKLKMRTAGPGGEILTRMGAATVFMPGGELYESMQRGVINAFEYGSADNAWDMGFQEVMDYLYISLTRAPSDGGYLGVRTEAFNALPDDLKEIVKLAAESSLDVYYNGAIVKAAVALQDIKDYGVSVQPLPKEIEDAFVAEAEAFFNEKKSKEGTYYGRVVESMRAFKVLCEAQGIY